MKTIEAISWGILAFVTALVTEVIFSIFAGRSFLEQTEFDLKRLLILVAIEEISKLIIMRKAFGAGNSDPRPILAFGSTFGLIEIGLLAQRSGLASAQDLLAASPIFMVHVTTSSIFGYCLGKRDFAWLASGLAAGTVFHAVYNFQESLQVIGQDLLWMQVVAMFLASISLLFAQNPGLHDKRV